MIKYSDYKNFSNELFENSLYEKVANNTELGYSGFEESVIWRSSESIIFSGTISKRIVRSNQREFMNKEIHKAIMVRSRLRNKFLKEKNCMQQRSI